MDPKPRYKIDDWALSKRVIRGDSERRGWVLVGRCDHHRQFLERSAEEQKQDSYITSSILLRFDFNKRIAESKNSIYELGSIDLIWAQFCEEEDVLLSSFNFDRRK